MSYQRNNFVGELPRRMQPSLARSPILIVVAIVQPLSPPIPFGRRPKQRDRSNREYHAPLFPAAAMPLRTCLLL
jgi:hypothetical protein